LSDGVGGSPKSFRLARAATYAAGLRAWKERAGKSLALLKNSPLIYWGFGGGRAGGRTDASSSRTCFTNPQRLGWDLAADAGNRIQDTRVAYSRGLRGVRLGISTTPLKFYQVVPRLRAGILFNYLPFSPIIIY
jgi:hypothetical protein